MTGQRHRAPLFCAYWKTVDGHRLERATRAQLREAVRLYWKHKDVRLGWERAECARRTRV